MPRCATLLSAFFLTCSAHAASGPVEGRQATVQGIIDEINASYIYPEKIRKLEPALRRAGLDKPMSDEVFAKTMTEVLAELTKDPHLKLLYNAEPAAVQSSTVPSPADIARQQANLQARLQAQNYGIERVERLPGNIGFLKMRSFAPASASAPFIGAAMTLLANSDALIIDLRDNGGGPTDAVPLLASYLFDERVHLADLYTPRGNITQQQWTSPTVPGTRFGGKKDVYLLTSKSTFSAAEGFAFALQNRKRVVLVGETTRGGAHPSRIKPISPHLRLMVPMSTARDPITLKDWEGVGVVPDVAVPAAEALTRAQILILNKLRERTQDAKLGVEIRTRLEELAPSS